MTYTCDILLVSCKQPVRFLIEDPLIPLERIHELFERKVVRLRREAGGKRGTKAKVHFFESGHGAELNGERSV